MRAKCQGNRGTSEIEFCSALVKVYNQKDLSYVLFFSLFPSFFLLLRHLRGITSRYNVVKNVSERALFNCQNVVSHYTSCILISWGIIAHTVTVIDKFMRCANIDDNICIYYCYSAVMFAEYTNLWI